jgi:hypothetical protein
VFRNEGLHYRTAPDLHQSRRYRWTQVLWILVTWKEEDFFALVIASLGEQRSSSSEIQGSEMQGKFCEIRVLPGRGDANEQRTRKEKNRRSQPLHTSPW